MTQFDLNAVDTDGAVRQAEEAVASDTRAAFFRKAAVTGGALGSAAFFTGMLPGIADAKPSKRQDIAILKYALTLEYLEAEFYEEAVRDGGLSGPALDAARLIADHEATHVTALRQTLRKLGAKVPAKPTFDFQGTNKGSKFVPTALVLENTGVRAYLGQAGRLKSGALLAAAASIVTVEARHAAAIAVLVNDNAFGDRGDNSITPYGAFDRASSMKRILREVGDTGFIQGS
ncbi:MAG: ferritin-like domain-containing protein [Actinomycetota bacterium]|nr:ferritin-like domain-containing protein [Actinomycetota bacterium]MDQ5808720.1 ferritin-like domain-containing protein [Actinomycetota bacterium]